MTSAINAEGDTTIEGGNVAWNVCVKHDKR